MEVQAVYRFARMSAFKVREVTREIQGMYASQALQHLTFVPRKAAVLVRKTLASAVANAENNNSADAAELVIKEAVVGEGPTLRRFKSRARGSASRIRKRTSHIKIILSDEIAVKVNKERDESKRASRQGRPVAERKGAATAVAAAPAKKAKAAAAPVVAEDATTEDSAS